MTNRANTFRREGHVEFADTDAAGLVHFSNYLRYVEATEWELFRRAGLKTLRTEENCKAGFPRVQVSANYHRPLHPNDSYAVELSVLRLGASSITYEASIYRTSGGEAVLAASVTMKTTYVEASGLDAPMKARIIPDAYRDALQPYLQSEQQS